MKNKLMIATLAAGMALAGCTTDPATGQQTINKGVLGAIGGAVAGAGISKATGGDETGRDAAIGAALGGAVGLYMEKQEQKLKEQLDGTGVTVDRDEQGNIDLVMPGNITFAHDDTSINPSFYNTLDKVATTMIEFNQNTAVIMGHTDSTGEDAYNQNLSERRATSVKSYLVNRGVAPSRLQTIGYGETRPIDSNATDYGRLQNRRVEIKLVAPTRVS